MDKEIDRCLVEDVIRRAVRQQTPHNALTEFELVCKILDGRSLRWEIFCYSEAYNAVDAEMWVTLKNLLIKPSFDSKLCVFKSWADGQDLPTRW